MDQYRQLYKWMFIPFIVVQVSIFNYYWPTFTSESWRIHIHFWLVSLWYILTIIQPYFISKRKLISHRTLGMIGFIVAGGVIFTGISLFDMLLELTRRINPSQPGPPVAFYYGTLIAEFFAILAFGLAVIKSIQYRKDIQNHAFWLIASVFYMIVPALGRGMILFWRAVLPPDNFNPLYVFISTELIYLPLFLLFAVKFGKIKHQATIIGIVLIVIRFISRPIGSIEAVQNFLHALIV